jgi:hypothetical protein
MARKMLTVQTVNLGAWDDEPSRRGRRPPPRRGDRRPPPRGRKWSEPVDKGNVRIRARDGYAVAVYEVEPGVLVVGELPEDLTNPRYGFIQAIVPGLLNAVAKGVDQGAKLLPISDKAKASVSQGTSAFRQVATPGQYAKDQARAATPAATPATAGPDLGCEGRRCRCRKRRNGTLELSGWIAEAAVLAGLAEPVE